MTRTATRWRVAAAAAAALMALVLMPTVPASAADLEVTTDEGVSGWGEVSCGFFMFRTLLVRVICNPQLSLQLGGQYAKRMQSYACLGNSDIYLANSTIFPSWEPLVSLDASPVDSIDTTNKHKNQFGVSLTSMLRPMFPEVNSFHL